MLGCTWVACLEGGNELSVLADKDQIDHNGALF
jgi:hypothetical protein